MPDPTETADSGMNVDAAASSIGAELFGAREDDSSEHEDADEVSLDSSDDEAPAEGAVAEETPAETPAVEKRAPPKSWSKDKHPLWETLTPEAQDYYETREKQFLDGLEQYKGDAGYAKQLRDILNPYRPMLQAQGISETDAVQYLMNAHYRLTQGSDGERRAAYEQIGRDLGFLQGGQPQGPTDPHVQQLQAKVNQLESNLTARQQAELQAVRQKIVSEVEVFASDQANVHFNDVANDMAALVKANPEITLKDAYDKAVWANPVTRAKELARIQTEAAANKEAERAEREKIVKRATATNVRGVESPKAPTEPNGKFLDDSSMRADLRAIRNRS